MGVQDWNISLAMLFREETSYRGLNAESYSTGKEKQGRVD